MTTKYLVEVDPLRRVAIIQSAIDGIAHFEQRGPLSQPEPRARILDPDFEYVPAAATDVQKTWRKFGWVPLAEVTK